VATLIRGIGERVVVRRGTADNIPTAAPLGAVLESMPELSDIAESAGTVDRAALMRRVQATLSTPTVLVFEDVHWADEATLDVLRYLGRRLDQLPVLVVATFRNDDAGPRHPLAIMMGDLTTAPGVSRMVLSPLTVEGVAGLVRAQGSSLDPARLHAVTAGNPFFVTEVLVTGDTSVPATVRDAVLARAVRRSLGAQRVLDAAAVLARPADVSLLAEVSGQDLAAVDECVEHGLLVVGGNGCGFRHELARMAVEGVLAPGAAVALSRGHATRLRASNLARSPGRLFARPRPP